MDADTRKAGDLMAEGISAAVRALLEDSQPRIEAGIWTGMLGRRDWLERRGRIHADDRDMREIGDIMAAALEEADDAARRGDRAVVWESLDRLVTNVATAQWQGSPGTLEDERAARRDLADLVRSTPGFAA